LSRALTLAHTHRVAHRSDLTERLRLTRTATGLILRELETLSLIRTAAATRACTGVPTTGRPSHAVEIHPDAPTVLAVQVQATSVLIAQARLGGVLGQVDEVPLPEPATPGSVLGLIAELLSARLATPDRPPIGIGLALPSAVGSDGTALAAHPLAWPHAVPARSMLTGLLARAGHGEVRVHVGNDANMAALAESRHGAGQGAAQMLYVMTGQVGVGGGLVVDGRLHLGSAGYALEIGHTPVPPGDRPCRCGNRGCLDVEADPTALLDAAGLSTTEPTLDAARAVIARRGADPRARAAADLVTRRLACGLASLINILNPDRVVLGGMHAELLTAEEERLRTGISRHSFLDQAARVELRPAELIASALVGAAEIALQPLLDDPRLVNREQDPPGDGAPSSPRRN
jgi:predicted NBD/HSP70 family sugar kinase